MELDSRFWSVFMFLTISALFLASICTPYRVKGATVSFGEVGLWRVNYNSTTSSGVSRYHFQLTQTLMSLAAAAVGLTFVGYIMLCHSITLLTQLFTFISQMTAGLLSIIAAGLFTSIDPVRGEGWWMALTAGVMYLLNGFVILIMPCLDSNEYKSPSRVTYV